MELEVHVHEVVAALAVTGNTQIHVLLRDS